LCVEDEVLSYRVYTLAERLLISFILLFLAQLPLPAQTDARSDYRVRISILEVPSAIVSRFVSSKVNQDGSVEGTIVSGNTTASFPKGVVILENRLKASPTDATIKSPIREFMASDRIRYEDVSVFDLASHDFFFDFKRLESQEVSQQIKEWPHEISCHLRVAPERKTENDLLVSVQLWMRLKNGLEIQPVGTQDPERLVLEQTVAVGIGQTSLIGFRADDKKLRDVFWLAVSAQKE
jgi:hypothetical protein